MYAATDVSNKTNWKGEKMSGKIFKIGISLVNIAFKNRIKESQRENFSDIISTLKDLGIDEFEARQIDRGFQQISDNISQSCKDILRNSDIALERQDTIIDHVIKAYESANIGVLRFFENNMNNSILEKTLLEVHSDYKHDLDTIEIEVYERMINHTANLMVNTFQSLPEFTINGINRLQFQMNNIVNKIEEIVETFKRINENFSDTSTIINNYNREFRQTIINKYSYINIFGASGLDPKLKKYRLSISYIELELCLNGVEKIVNPKKLLDNYDKNIWIVGDAGSGKTTLLQWIATTVATDTEEIKGTRAMVPLLIELRQFAKEEINIKKFIEKIMNNSSYNIPEGWVERNISSGCFLFLIDGFDEVESNIRNRIFNWLDEIDPENKCKKIFTSRPHVKERPFLKKISEYRVLPMYKRKIKHFIRYWHRAVLEEQLEIDSNDSKSISEKLFEKFQSSESLMKLASNPLLCAMICALHYRNGMNLPSSKRDIYEECCKMLFENRDKERELALNKFNLTYEQKKIILAQLAYWMMKNNYVVVSKSQANNVIKRTVLGMDIETEGKNKQEILEYLLERCGVLREPEVHKVDFIHRTFQEYLTANEISRNEDWGYLKEKIDDELWQETIVLSIGYGKKAIADDLITTTLYKKTGLKKDNKNLFIAIRFLSGAIEVDKKIRDNIEIKLSKIVPPQLNECLNLALSGDLVVPYLKYHSEFNAIQNLACLRTLRIIGTEKALEILKTYFSHDLTTDELKEIGLLINQFEDKDLIENDIPLIISNYIQQTYFDNVIIHNAFVRPIRLFDQITVNKRVRSIWFMDYEDYEDYEEFNFQSIFPNVEKIMINGDFINLDIISCFTNLKEVFIVSGNDMFSLYELNKYINIYNIQKFKAVLVGYEFINGNDLAFLMKCRNLGIYLLNLQSEFSLENFYKLCNLENLEIGLPYEDDYEISYTKKFNINKRYIDEDLLVEDFASVFNDLYRYLLEEYNGNHENVIDKMLSDNIMAEF